MAQWFAFKAEHEDALLFFRMGDFYELFFADAEAAAAALDIQLTARGQHAGAPVPMCGVPVHQAELYLARLIRRGFRVAIVEQMEDPAAAKARGAKGPLKRAVVRLVTAGTLTEDALLEAGRPNFLTALAGAGADVGAAWIDISTGTFETATVPAAQLEALLGRIDPAEIVTHADGLALGAHAARRADIARLALSVPAGPAAARRALAHAFGAASLDAFGTFSDAEAAAASLALAYVRATQMGATPRLSHPAPVGGDGLMAMDQATRESLEILRTRSGQEAGSLIAAIRRTVSPAGGRLLARWLAAPITDLELLTERQTAWLALRDSRQVEALRAALRGAPDMARALGRLSLGRAGPRDLAAIAAGLGVAASIAPLLPPARPLLDRTARGLAGGAELGPLLARALAVPAPPKLEDGGAIAAGFDPELDAERRLRDETRAVIAGLQLDLAQRYGVASLKIRHHAQFGYLAEVPAAAAEALRAHPEFHIRQGLAGAARFSHPELAALDEQISAASARAAARERAVFAYLCRQTLAQAEPLAGCAEALALLDVLQSAACLAEAGRWCRPDLSDDAALDIRAGRHPVVEDSLPPGAAFIPNRCDLSPACRLMLLTGPNMAGKSTYLRQNALMVILAQAGLPVPAEAMRLGLVDRLFSRVGAADDLAAGRSTFMMEMTETAAILHQAGPKSFVIVDEIGRGTGTRDGLAIAQAVLEALHDSIRCRGIFATHFHELSQLAEALPRLKPHTMRVKEWKGEVVFLHEVAAGSAGRSWGVHVARLAGVPEAVAARAERLLKTAERAGPVTAPLPLFAKPEPPDDGVREAILALDPEALTPRAALDALYELKSKLVVLQEGEG